MRRDLHAEWTKLRTVRSSGWLLLATVVVTVAVSAMWTGTVKTSQCLSPAECHWDTTRLSLSGVWLGQAAVAVLTMLTITGEYGTGLIRATLMANPRRVAVLAAKAGVVTVTALAAGALGVGGSLLAGRMILLANGFTPANGYSPLSPADEPTLRAAVGSVLYLGLIALLSLAIGTIVRDTAGAIVTVLTVLYLVPVAVGLVSDPAWAERLQRLGPTTAGLTIQATQNLEDLAIDPWAGLGVLAAYTAAAMILAALLFTLRDP